TVWAETFEGACPNGWTLTGDWQCGAPTSGPGGAFGGIQCIATQLAGDYNSNQSWGTADATSPAVSLVGTTAPLLRFRVWHDTESGYDGWNVKVSTDGTTYTLLSTVTPTYNDTVSNEACFSGDEA